MSTAARDTYKPCAAIVDYTGIPEELKRLPHWVIWQYWWDPKRGAWAKPPYGLIKKPDGTRSWAAAKVDDADTWVTFNQAKDRYYYGNDGSIDGVGIVATRASGYIHGDLDGCFDQNGELKPWVRKIIDSGAWHVTESPSRDDTNRPTGLHLCGRGTMVQDGRKKPWWDGQTECAIELYVAAHYITQTGRRLPGTSETIGDVQESVDAILAEYFSDDDDGTGDPGHIADTPDVPHLDDDELIDKIMHSAQSKKFKRLYIHGDWSEYTKQGKTHSEADFGLMGILVSWTDDVEQAVRIFLQSALVRADKRRTEAGYEKYVRRSVKRAMRNRVNNKWWAYSGQRPASTRPALHIVKPDDDRQQATLADLARWRDDERRLQKDKRLHDSDVRLCILVWDHIKSYPSDPNLADQPHIVVYLDEVAAWLGVQKPTASKKLRRLEELGLIARDTSGYDDGDYRWMIKAGALPADEMSKDDLQTSDRISDVNYHRQHSKPRCRVCTSDRLIPETLICEDCGARSTIQEAQKAAVDYDVAIANPSTLESEKKDQVQWVAESETCVHRGDTDGSNRRTCARLVPTDELAVADSPTQPPVSTPVVSTPNPALEDHPNDALGHPDDPSITTAKREEPVTAVELDQSASMPVSTADNGAGDQVSTLRSTVDDQQQGTVPAAGLPGGPSVPASSESVPASRLDNRGDFFTTTADDPGPATHDLAIVLNVHRRHLSKEQRAEFAATLKRQGWSVRRTAKALGVSHTTVVRDLSGGTTVTPDSPERTIGKDGKSYPTRRPKALTQPVAQEGVIASQTPAPLDSAVTDDIDYLPRPVLDRYIKESAWRRKYRYDNPAMERAAQRRSSYRIRDPVPA